MLVAVRVTGRPLDLRGALYHVGERMTLDTENPLDSRILAADGWVERVEEPVPARATQPVTTAFNHAPVDRMVASASKKANRK